MFFDFYGLDEQPFGVTPDPRFLYMGPAQQEALASLQYGIQTGRGFIALIAAPGLGKTTMLLHLLEGLGTSTRSAFLVQMHANAKELLRSLLADLDAVPVGNDLGGLQGQLRDVLVKEAQAGRRFVVVIDEAQNLDDEILEAVRMLSNFETSSSKLMQIVLSGQPQLADKLAAPHLEQLRQRISIIARFPPLDEDDVPKYIHHRLNVAGYRGPALFTPEAMDLIVSHCKGIPRNINNVCFHAMSLGCVKHHKQIDDATVQTVIADLNLATLGTASPAPQRSVAATRSESAAPSETVLEEPVQEPRDFDFDVAGDLPVGAAVTGAELLGSEESPPVDAAVARAEQAQITKDFATTKLKADANPRQATVALPMDLGEPEEEDKALDGVTIAAGPAVQQAYTMPTMNRSAPVKAATGRWRKGDFALLLAFGLAILVGWLWIGPWVVSKLSRNADTSSDEPTMQSDQSTTPSATPKPADTEQSRFPLVDAPPKPESQFGKAPNADTSEADHDQVAASTTEVPPAPVREAPPPAVSSDLGSGSRMVVESTTGGGRITVDGRSNPAWTTTHVFTLSPGSHLIRVSKSGYTEWSARVSVEPGAEKFVMANLESEDGGIFTVETDPPGMQVFIDGKSYGRSRVDTALRAGWHEYKVIPQPGMAAVTYRFQLKPGEILTKKIRMTIPSSSLQYPNRGANDDAASLSSNR